MKGNVLLNHIVCRYVNKAISYKVESMIATKLGRRQIYHVQVFLFHISGKFVKLGILKDQKEGKCHTCTHLNNLQ